MNYFLEPYEKIRKLRKKYKITQKELAGELYTQGYITALERGKKKLTDKNIIELVGRLNKILEEKGIGERIKVEDIKMDKTESETIFIEGLINEITGIKNKKELVQKLKSIKLKITQTDIKNQIKIYEIICKVAKKFEEWEELKEAAAFLVMKRERDTDSTKFGEAFLELTRACAHTEDAEYINAFEENYFEKIKQIEDSSKEKIYYNLGLIFSDSSYKEKALYFLNEISTIKTRELLEVEVDINRAYCLDNLERYEEAKEIYKSIIRKNNRERYYLIWAKQNLTNILRIEDKVEEVKKNYSFLKKEMKKNENEVETMWYGSLGKTAKYLNKIKEAREYYEASLDNALENYESYWESYYIEDLRDLIDLYKKKDFEKVKKYEKVLENLVKKSSIKEASFIFMKYYLKNKFYEALEEFMMLCEKL